MRVFVLLLLFLCSQALPVHRLLQAGGPGGSVVKRRGRPQQDTPSGAQWNVTGTRGRPRCGVPDFPAVREEELQRGGRGLKLQRSKRFALFGGRWDKTDLTYKIVRFPWQMSEDKVRRVFLEALAVWSDVTPLTFREIKDQNADIIIDFNRYWHGDSLPFDGPGGVLAHAFFPRTHRQGEVHFDYDEHWTVGNGVGTDLLQVAAHEFGHALGLQHSLEPGAVMCPFYSDSYPLRLSEDDKRGIQYLYGPPRPPRPSPPGPGPPETPQTNEVDSGLPDACRTSFDAVSMIRGELFFFKSRYVWRLRDDRLQPGYPALSSRHWRGIPERIDAAYEDKAGNIWFFQGESYWVFDAERKVWGPDSVGRLGLPVAHIQAALRWEEDRAEKVFFFKSASYWSLDVHENRVDDVRPRSTESWSGVPGDIDGAFRDRYGYINFLSGLQYWKLDPVGLRVLDGFPRSIGPDFFSCSA